MTRHFIPAAHDLDIHDCIDDVVTTSLMDALAAARRHDQAVYELVEVRCLCDAIGVPFNPTCELHRGTREDRCAAEPLVEKHPSGGCYRFIGSQRIVEEVCYLLQYNHGDGDALRDKHPDVTLEMIEVAFRVAEGRIPINRRP